MPQSDKRPWKVLLELAPTATRLLVTGEHGDILKAQLPARPDHCRALTFMVEGLALWCGSPLCVAVSAEHPVSHSYGLGSFGDDWPDESALVRYEFVGASGPDDLRIAGVGDFRVLRTMQRWSAKP